MTHAEASSGVSEAEAAARLGAEGYNELPAAGRRGGLAIARDVAREPMFLLLIAAGLLYFAIGDVQEAVMLTACIVVILGITTYQEGKTERALEALRDLSSPRALVVRDGEPRRIPGREVVRGDVVILGEGDRVPADGRLLAANDLAVDESLLTGESVPVRKVAGDESSPAAAPGGDDLPFVYSGTLVVAGQGIALVQATGAHTEIGRIGKRLGDIAPEATPLQQQSRRLVRAFAALGLGTCALVVVGYGLTRNDWLGAILAGITAAMSLLPEEIPVVLTVFLALGAWRLTQQRVLARRAAAIEALGSATILCVDKTGTLTSNRMAVARLVVGAEVIDRPTGHREALPAPFRELLACAVLASEVNPVDPMERALYDAGDQGAGGDPWPPSDWSLVHEYGLTPGLLAKSHVWELPDGGRCVVAAKGAPEAIARLCRLERDETRALLAATEAQAGEGLRMLGVARAEFTGGAWPAEQTGFDFHFLGLIGLADPVRPTARPALAECVTAGIRVVMITGDYPATAQAVAGQIGLPVEGVIRGDELRDMDDAELRRRISLTTIFARVVPEQKLRLISALKANGEVVAMTGDGVNDAPALKAAHIGIAMGERGTDVAREAAALVLLDDDFAAIVAAVRMGRRIFDNIAKAIAYILAIHVPIAGIALFPVLFGWPLVLAPVHVVFLELIIDPICSIAFEAEPEEADVMRRPPRAPSQQLFTARALGPALLQGLAVLIGVTAVYAEALAQEQTAAAARAYAFTTLILANLGLIFVNRSRSQTLMETLTSPNRALWLVCGAALIFLGLVLGVPFLREAFQFGTPSWPGLLVCLTVALASVGWFDVAKLLRRR